MAGIIRSILSLNPPNLAHPLSTMQKYILIDWPWIILSLV